MTYTILKPKGLETLRKFKGLVGDMLFIYVEHKESRVVTIEAAYDRIYCVIL